jgi:hypothetical protein
MLRLPIGLHLVLIILADMLGFFGGALVGFVLFGLVPRPADSSSGLLAAVGVVSFIGGVGLGLVLCHAAAARLVPARCPQCGGSTYFRPGTPITYHCTSCQHVHVTRVSGDAGHYRGPTRKGR